MVSAILTSYVVGHIQTHLGEKPSEIAVKRVVLRVTIYANTSAHIYKISRSSLSIAMSIVATKVPSFKVVSRHTWETSTTYASYVK